MPTHAVVKYVTGYVHVHTFKDDMKKHSKTDQYILY